MPEASTRSSGSRELSCLGNLKSELLKDVAATSHDRPDATQTEKVGRSSEEATQRLV